MKRIKEFFNSNMDLIVFFLISIFIELFAITYTTCGFYLSRPIYPLMVLIFLIGFLLLIKNKVWRFVIAVLLSIIQIVMYTAFIFLFDSNGTVFIFPSSTSISYCISLIKSLNSEGVSICFRMIITAKRSFFP